MTDLETQLGGRLKFATMIFHDCSRRLAKELGFESSQTINPHYAESWVECTSNYCRQTRELLKEAGINVS